MHGLGFFFRTFLGCFSSRQPTSRPGPTTCRATCRYFLVKSDYQYIYTRTSMIQTAALARYYDPAFFQYPARKLCHAPKELRAIYNTSNIIQFGDSVARSSTRAHRYSEGLLSTWYDTSTSIQLQTDQVFLLSGMDPYSDSENLSKPYHHHWKKKKSVPHKFQAVRPKTTTALLNPTRKAVPFSSGQITCN